MEKELEQARIESYPRRERKNGINWAVFTVSILVWGILAYGGYFIANNYIKSTEAYIDQRLAEIQTENTENIKNVETELTNLHNELLNVRSELVFIQEDLDLTGESLNGADETKVALQERISDLDKQLGTLQQSIARLEEAAK